jgi:hypothetical protein
MDRIVGFSSLEGSISGMAHLQALILPLVQPARHPVEVDVDVETVEVASTEVVVVA